MGRKRSEKRRDDWPTYLIERVSAGRRYYSYEHPKLAKPVPLGTNLKAAVAAVKIAQVRLAPNEVHELLARIERPPSTVSEHKKWFLETHLPGRRTKAGTSFAQSTLDNYTLYLGHAEKAWGPRAIQTVTRAQVAEFIETYPPDAGNKLRGMLSKFFVQARARGLRDDNPVEGTVMRDTVVQRDRLDHARYVVIHAKAPPWLQRAMTLCLLSLQRPSDLSTALRADWRDGAWHVRQTKSRGHGYGLLRILPHDALREAIQACYDNPVEDCPYLLAREPEKRRAAKGRGHWAQLSDEILSRAFAEIRDGRTKALKWKWAGTSASFYEIKALGARLYEEAGWPVPRIQALAGHQDEATTRIYTDRHKEKWIEVTL